MGTELGYNLSPGSEQDEVEVQGGASIGQAEVRELSDPSETPGEGSTGGGEDPGVAPRLLGPAEVPGAWGSHPGPVLLPGQEANPAEARGRPSSSLSPTRFPATRPPWPNSTEITGK